MRGRDELFAAIGRKEASFPTSRSRGGSLAAGPKGTIKKGVYTRRVYRRRRKTRDEAITRCREQEEKAFVEKKKNPCPPFQGPIEEKEPSLGTQSPPVRGREKRGDQLLQRYFTPFGRVEKEEK